MAAQNNIICVDQAWSLPSVADTTECMFSSSACKRPDPYVEIRLGSVGCESHHLDNTVSPDFAAEHGGKVCEAAGYGVVIVETVGVGQSGNDPTLAGRLRNFRIESEGRDTVQPRLQRQEVVLKWRALTDFVQFVQRNRLFLRERACLGPPEVGNVAARSKGQRDIACKRPDVGALADRRLQRDALGNFERCGRVERVRAAGGGLKGGFQFRIVTPNLFRGPVLGFWRADQVEGWMPKQVRHDGGGKVAHSFSPSDLPIWIPAKVKPPASMMMATIRETISKGVMAASY